ncbi:SIS domain-containing protein [Lichenihabitans psoromatis]|uniref:SIS domain-containing protein n=1 Tax=Lichenihabitans psoromatis TaxID=2528642 RepID=UPI001036C5EC|nr:SIS domain-containing protein [Lichenihabitans psoromatis]
MNITEQVIREQFPFWAKAPAVAALPADGTDYVIVGCGTSYYLAQIVAASFNLKGLSAKAVPGAEWARRRKAYVVDDSRTHVIALSRSGESTETVQAVEVSRAAGLTTTAITCAEGSSIVRAAATTIYAETHPGEGIVMTSSASLMLLEGLRLAGIAMSPSLAAEALAILDKTDATLKAALQGRSHFVYLGAGALYGLAEEGALKLQEMSISYSQAYHPMEYRHGPISLVDDKTFVVMLYSPETRDEEAKVAAELTAKGARVLGFGGPGDIEIAVPDETLTRALAILPALQILGERVAEQRNVDTVAPRHLSKVVVLV